MKIEALKYIVLIAASWLFALLQISFLSHFEVYGKGINLFFIALFLLNFFENPKNNFGIIAGLTSGFFLDIFSNSSLGLFTITFACLAFLTKKLVFSLRNLKTFSFLFSFACSFSFYSLVLFFVNTGFNLILKNKISLELDILAFLLGFLYNLLACLIIFSFIKLKTARKSLS